MKASRDAKTTRQREYAKGNENALKGRERGKKKKMMMMRARRYAMGKTMGAVTAFPQWMAWMRSERVPVKRKKKRRGRRRKRGRRTKAVSPTHSTHHPNRILHKTSTHQTPQYTDTKERGC
jgi:hypothetical protein